MIEALGGWLKQIIVIILIATFVDLALPGSSMQRYVKVVVSLFILLTILTPVIQLIRSDADPAAWFAGAESGTEGPSRLPELQSVLREGERMRGNREREAVEMVRGQVAEAVRIEVEQRFAVDVRQVQVGIGEDEEGRLRLESLVVTVDDGAVMAAARTGQGTGSDSSAPERGGSVADEDTGGGEDAIHTVGPVKPIEPIDPVQPVSISVEVSSGAEEDAGHEAAAKEPRLTGESGSEKGKMPEKADDIRRWLAERWELAADYIQIRSAEGR